MSREDCRVEGKDCIRLDKGELSVPKAKYRTRAFDYFDGL